jgi:hypothetical protein
MDTARAPIQQYTRSIMRWLKKRVQGRDEGSATAEYAIATMAAVGFAGLLVVIMRSDEVRGILTNLVRDALTYGG